MNKPRTVTAAIVAALVALCVLWSLRACRRETEGHGRPAVRVENPSRGTLVEMVNAPGRIEARKKIVIRSRISAQIVEIPYRVGMQVTKGDPRATPPIPPSVILRLDDSDLKAELNSANARSAGQSTQIQIAKVGIETRKAEIQRAQITLAHSERELKRQKKLSQENVVSVSEIDASQSRVAELRAQLMMAENNLKNAELALDLSRHNLEAAQADIARARESLGHTTVTSPIDGVVTRVNAEEGEMATGSLYNPGPLIMEVADLSQVVLQAEVNDTDIAKLRVGQRAEAHIQAWPDRRFAGKVSSTALATTEISRENRYFEVEILLDPCDIQLFSGLAADVDIQIEEHRDALKVPSQAVLARDIDDLPAEVRDQVPELDRNKRLVVVVYRLIDGKAVVTPVTIGKSDATHTIIRSGLDEKDRVVTGPYKVLETLSHGRTIKENGN